MKWIPILLLAYCILAVAVTLYIGIAQYNAWQIAGESLRLSREQLSSAQEFAEAARAEWLDLDNEQRANRSEYDGPQAVDIGYSAQIAYEDYQLADQQFDAVRQRTDELEEHTRTAAKNLVPLSIGLLLHLLGILFLWPTSGKGSRITGSGRFS